MSIEFIGIMLLFLILGKEIRCNEKEGLPQKIMYRTRDSFQFFNCSAQFSDRPVMLRQIGEDSCALKGSVQYFPHIGFMLDFGKLYDSPKGHYSCFYRTDKGNGAHRHREFILVHVDNFGKESFETPIRRPSLGQSPRGCNRICGDHSICQRSDNGVEECECMEGYERNASLDCVLKCERLDEVHSCLKTFKVVCERLPVLKERFLKLIFRN